MEPLLIKLGREIFPGQHSWLLVLGVHNKVVGLLLSSGATIEIEGSRFKSAEGTARAFRKEAILKILDEHPERSNRKGMDLLKEAKWSGLQV